MRTQLATAATTALTAAFMTTAALAGDISTVPPEPAPTAPSMDWSGFYGGLSLSANNGSYSGILIEEPRHGFPDDDGSWSGNGYGIVVGHNWQRDRFVYGAELALSSSDVSGKEDCLELDTRVAVNCDASLDKQASLRARLGMLTGQKTLAFATLGVVRADVSATFKATAVANPENSFSATGTETFNGVVYGIGVEHAFTPKFSLRASVLKHDFEEKDLKIKGDIGSPIIKNFDVDMGSIELTAIFRF